MSKLFVASVSVAFAMLLAPSLSANLIPPPRAAAFQRSEAAFGGAEVERALQAAQAVPGDESYQRVYEAFTKLMDNVSNNSLGNVRKLVSRLDQLVGAPSGEKQQAGNEKQKQKQKQQQQPTRQQQNEQQSIDEKTEQILNRLDRVNKETDQHTLRQLNEDIGRLIGTLNDSYLRNIRRVIERVNKVVGQPEGAGGSGAIAVVTSGETLLHQSGDRLEDPTKQPGFPGWDELLVAMDRVQKSLANFVRSSTKLITSG